MGINFQFLFYFTWILHEKKQLNEEQESMVKGLQVG